MSKELKRPFIPGENRMITIDTNRIINPDFAGVGVDIIPCNLMKHNLSMGYNHAYWEMDRKRLLMMKPKLARVWFQNDWMETTKGTYTWESEKMLAFYKYMDVLKAAGTEIEFNFGWKVGRDIQNWFSIPGIEGRISAPKDLEAYAAACSACLNELINVRGFDNIKYLTFYNEPNGDWDFECPGNQKAYYARMVQKAHDRLTADGIRSWVKILGPEETGDFDWFKYMKDNKDNCFDGYSFHTYDGTYNDLLKFVKERVNYTAPKPVYLTEFGFRKEEDSNWAAGYANSIIGGANGGLSGMAVWQLNGVWCEDPDEGILTNGDYTLCDALYTDMYPKNSYYQVSMLERYIPARSTVISAITSAQDVRAAAFKTSEGDYTIVVECKANAAKSLTIDFNGVNIGKTFGKHIYTDDVIKERNALIPARKGTFSAGTSFIDSCIPNDYGVIVYTTLPAQTQVEVKPAVDSVGKGAKCKLSASVIDNKGGVNWSIVSGAGTINSSGIYTAPVDAASGDMVAVKAASTADPDAYGIALLTIS